MARGRFVPSRTAPGFRSTVVGRSDRGKYVFKKCFFESWRLTGPFRALQLMRASTQAGIQRWEPRLAITDPTILIVEDNELNRRLYRNGLKCHGFATLETDRAVDVLNLIRTHRPDAVLMDIQLPETSGFEATRWIKSDSELRDTPVIALSAFAIPPENEMLKGVGCDAYLAKPVPMEELVRVIRCHLPPRHRERSPGEGRSLDGPVNS